VTGVIFADASESATLTHQFTTGGVPGGSPDDPTTVTLVVTSPTGVSTTYTYAGTTITKLATGLYSKAVACPEAGTWQAQWTGTGTAAEADVVTWDVEETSLGHLYATVAALKSRLKIPADDTEDDAELHAACFASSRALEHYCQRLFWRGPSTSRVFVADDPCELTFGAYNDFVSVSAIATDEDGDGVFETTWATRDYELLPHNPTAAPEPRPYTGLRCIGGRLLPLPIPLGREARVQATGVPGWPSVPYGIRQASAILSAETFRLKDAPGGGIAGMSEFGIVRIRENPQVARFADPYRLYQAFVA
jgi:hypothetical protein